MMKKDDLRVYSKSIVYFTFSLSFTFQAKSFSFFILICKKCFTMKTACECMKRYSSFLLLILEMFLHLALLRWEMENLPEGEKHLYTSSIRLLWYSYQLESTPQWWVVLSTWAGLNLLSLTFRQWKTWFYNLMKLRLNFLAWMPSLHLKKNRGIANHLVMKQGGGCIRVVVVFKQQGSEGF